MSGRRKAKIGANDDGYPFETGHWAAWTNVKRMRWMQNFRDRLAVTRTAGRWVNGSDYPKGTSRRCIDDTAALENLVEREQAAKKLHAIETQMNTAADQILQTFDKTSKRSIYLPPNAILKKKDN